MDILNQDPKFFLRYDINFSYSKSSCQSHKNRALFFFSKVTYLESIKSVSTPFQLLFFHPPQTVKAIHLSVHVSKQAGSIPTKLFTVIVSKTSINLFARHTIIPHRVCNSKGVGDSVGYK